MKNKTNEISLCEVCGSDNLTPVLDLGLHPMCDDLVEVGDNRVCNEYLIDILFCEQCLTAHQHFQVPKKDLFPKDYHYRSRFTADVLKGMEQLVDKCQEEFGNLNHKLVLDIGCNDGSLLDFFKDYGCDTIGVEPTMAYLDAYNKGHSIFNGYLTEELSNKIVSKKGKPDLIVFTNVFAHIEDLKSVLNSLKVLMKNETVIVIENHYLGSVLEKNQFDTFYHEHPRTYSFTSFDYIARDLGINILNVEFPSRYGGNIRIFMGNTGETIDGALKNKILEGESKFLDDFKTLKSNINKWVEKKRKLMNNAVNVHGKLPAKAFPGRAAILIKMLGIDENIISKVYERDGSLKVGHYVPGTRIEIDSDSNLFDKGTQDIPLINLAWHISGEISEYMKNNSYNGEIINIIDSSDFDQ